MDWGKRYKDETGEDTSYGKEPFCYPGRLDYFYYDEYVAWLEAKLTAATQQTNRLSLTKRSDFPPITLLAVKE